jgi:hypothetical protein
MLGAHDGMIIEPEVGYRSFVGKGFTLQAQASAESNTILAINTFPPHFHRRRRPALPGFSLKAGSPVSARPRSFPMILIAIRSTAAGRSLASADIRGCWAIVQIRLHIDAW